MFRPLLVMWLGLAVGAGMACSSTSNQGDGGAGGSGDAGTGGAGTGGGAGGADAGTGGAGIDASGDTASDGTGPGGDAGVTCNPSCAAGSVCVGNVTIGGVVLMQNDAGVCPTGTHPTGTLGRCERDPTYSCAPTPASCGATLTCACAATVCASLHICQSTSPGQVNCAQLVP